MEHKKWVILCFIGGILMVISSVVGSVGFIGTVLTLAAEALGVETTQYFSILLTVLGYIAAGGGISVMVGALIAGYGPDRIGRIVVGIGIGTGILGLIIILITNLITGVSISDLPNIFLSAFNGTYGLVGVLISIFSRMRLNGHTLIFINFNLKSKFYQYFFLISFFNKKIKNLNSLKSKIY